MSGPREGNCCVCGKHIPSYYSHWFDKKSGVMYCTDPDRDNPAPIGPCYMAGRERWIKDNWKLMERLMFENGFTYYTDG